MQVVFNTVVGLCQWVGNTLLSTNSYIRKAWFLFTGQCSWSVWGLVEKKCQHEAWVHTLTWGHIVHNRPPRLLMFSSSFFNIDADINGRSWTVWPQASRVWTKLHTHVSTWPKWLRKTFPVIQNQAFLEQLLTELRGIATSHTCSPCTASHTTWYGWCQCLCTLVCFTVCV